MRINLKRTKIAMVIMEWKMTLTLATLPIRDTTQTVSMCLGQKEMTMTITKRTCQVKAALKVKVSSTSAIVTRRARNETRRIILTRSTLSTKRTLLKKKTLRRKRKKLKIRNSKLRNRRRTKKTKRKSLLVRIFSRLNYKFYIFRWSIVREKT